MPTDCAAGGNEGGGKATQLTHSLTHYLFSVLVLLGGRGRSNQLARVGGPPFGVSLYFSSPPLLLIPAATTADPFMKVVPCNR